MKAVKDFLTQHGATVVGFADLAPVPEPMRRGFPRAISFGLALDRPVVAGITEGPTQAYLQLYHDSNARLTAMAEESAAWLRERGARAEARPSTGDWDKETLRAPFSHKMAATLSGLGWIGKCDLLVTETYGSAVRWASILTDAPLPTGEPIVESRCGDCTACVKACPGEACSGKLWRRGMAREEFWDPRACMAGMAKINRDRGTAFGICGKCIAACPLTQAYLKRTA
jgi:epoxyqueuosine reductase QueG